ncbi:MAG: transposase, partial [Phycisphaerae bacterium]
RCSISKYSRADIAHQKGRLCDDLPPEETAGVRAHLDQRAGASVLPIRCDPEEERVAARRRKRGHWLFAFLDPPGAEPTNNRAEQVLRPPVIVRKLSRGNGTERGKRTWEILAGITATCQPTGRDSVQAVQPYLLLKPA